MAGDATGLRGTGLAVGGVAAVLAGWGFGTPALVVLGAGLAALPALAWLSVLLVARGLRVERTVEPARCVAGERVLITCRPAGLPVRLGRLDAAFDVEIDPRPGTARGSGPPVRGGPGRWRIGPVPRGDHRLPAPVVRVRDPLGLVRHSRRAPWSGPERIVAVPATVPIAALRLGDRTVGHAGAGARPVAGAGELERVREHHPGDPLHRIHWGHTARRGRLHTKELRDLDPAGAGAEIILDGAVAPGGDFELAVSAAATIARHLLGRGERVALTHTGGHPAHVAAAGATRGAVEAVLTLARPGTDTPAADAVATAVHRPGRPGTVIVVTAGPTPRLAAAVARARAAGLAAAVIVTGNLDGAGVGAVGEGVPVIRVRERAALAGALERGAMAAGSHAA